MVLENELTFTNGVTKEYSDQFAVVGAKIGNTINVRRPGRFIGTTGPALNVEDFYESSTPVTLTTQFHVDTQFTTQDLALSLDMFSQRVLTPAIAAIANKIDRDGLLMAKNATANIVGTPGTPATGLNTYLTAGAYLDSEGTPRDGNRTVVIDPFAQVSIVDSLKGLLVPSDKVGGQYTRGTMGRDTGGMNWKMDQNVISHTFGSWTTTAGAVTVSGAGQGLSAGWASTSSLNLTTTQGLTLQQGDTFTIAGVYAVNPQSRQSYGRLRTFVVQSAITTASGAFSVTVSPALIYSGQFQNVSASPANSAAVTPTSIATTAANAVSSPQAILYHRNAFTMVAADLELPEGVHFAGRSADKDVGLSIRVVRQYTINNDAIPTRLDVLYGWAPLYQEMACRVSN